MVRTGRSIFNGDTAPAVVGRQSEWRRANDLRAIEDETGEECHDPPTGRQDWTEVYTPESKDQP
jgi:hypothetical protein